jgi:hypothetical protein
VQKVLMRRASIQTTMNIYGKAMTDKKRRAQSKIVELILKPKKPTESWQWRCPPCGWYLRDFWGVLFGVLKYGKLLPLLVAGAGFEPATFGL